MKKKLNLLTISAALLLGLTACGGQQPAASSSAPAPTTSETPSTPASEAPSTPASEAPSTPTVDYAALAEAGYQQISATYDDWAKGITTDQTIYLEVTVEGVKFTVSYTVAEAAKNYLKVEGNKLVVTTDKEDHLFAKAVKVNVGIGEHVYYSHELNVKILGVSALTIAEIWDLKDGDAVTTRGKVTAMYGTSFFIQDGAAGTEVYTSKDWGVKVGNYVEVAGVISVYSGLYEVKPNTEGGVVVLESAGGVADPVTIDLDATGVDLTVAKNVGGRAFSGTNLYVKSINVGTGSSGYHYIEGKLVLGGKEGTVELAMRIDDRYAAAADLATWGWKDNNGTITLDGTVEAGDTISATGVITWYSGAQVALGTIKNVTKGEAIVATPIALADLYVTGDGALAVDTLVSLKGKVVANYNAESQGGFFVADGEYGAYIYRAALPEGVAVGDYVSLEGNVGLYKDTRQITGAKNVVKLADGTGIADPVALDGTATLGYANQNRPIALTGTLESIAVDNYGNVSGKLIVGEAGFSFKFDSRYVDLTKLAAAFGWAKSEDNKYSITAEKGGTVTINGVSTYQDGAASVFGITASDYTAPAAPVVTPLSTIEEGWALAKGDAIRTRGKVTEMYGNSFFMQNGAFATEVYLSAASGAKVGDYVEVEGTVDIYKGLFEVKPAAAADVKVLEDHTDIAEPTVITLDENMDLSAAKSTGGRLYSGDAVVKTISLNKQTGSGGVEYYVLTGELLVGEKSVAYRLDDRYTDLKSWGVTYTDGVPALGEIVDEYDTVSISGIVTWYDKAQIATAAISAVTKGEAPAVDPEEEAKSMTLDVKTLQLPASYGDGEATIDDVKWTTYQTANYGDGIQMRYKSSKASCFYNTTALPKNVKSVEFNFNTAKMTKAMTGQLFLACGNASQKDAADGTAVDFDGTNGKVTIDVTGDDVTFLKISHTSPSQSFTVYLNSVVIHYAEEGGEEIPAAKALPVVPSGNSGRKTCIEGAGAWIYLDNTNLGITGANAAAIITASEIKVAAAYNGEDAGAKATVESGINIVSSEFNDYDDANHTVRLHIVMDKGTDASWGVKFTFTLKIVIGEDTYAGVVEFVGGVFQAE